MLRQKSVNASNLDIIEKALFIVVIDNEPADDDLTFAHHLLTQTSHSRWFDKSLQWIVTTNGSVGVNIEHTPADGQSWQPFFSYIDQRLQQQQFHNAPEPLISSKLLEWQIDTLLLQDIETTRKTIEPLEQIQLEIFSWPEFSRSALKSCNTSLDAFCQLAFQVASWRTWKKLQSTYEAVSMRHFRFGRTEYIRACSAEAETFARSFAETNNPLLLLSAYRSAEAEHIRRTRACQQGQGFERHLFALEGIWNHFFKNQRMSRPALFDSPEKNKLTCNRLSTSTSSNPSVRTFAFGSVKDDGLGVAYETNSQHLKLAISYFPATKADAKAFIRNLHDTLRDLGQLIGVSSDEQNAENNTV